MEKLRMESIDLTQKNIEKIGTLFPNVITEKRDENGNLKKGINFELLKQELSGVVVDGEECYDFTWVGKKAAIVEGNTPIRKTLRPCIEESKDWESTGNLYIEGDNLDVLKLLQESYLNSIKMIYIDPPYNTGNDFIYKDNFSMDKDEYEEEIGLYDEEDNRLFKNTETNGRFHSDWCSMLFPRLKLAHNLLRDDGVIFISIDDNELDNLKKICNEIFGENNFIACICWQRAYAPVNMNKWFSPNHDFALVYAKRINDFKLTKLPRTKKQNKDYVNIDNDPRGPWKVGNPSVGPAVEKNIYEITLPSGRVVLPPKGRSWLYSKEKFEQMKADNRIYFGKDGNSTWAPKMFLSEVSQGLTPQTLWLYSDVGHSQDATKELKALFDNKSYFDYPKPVSYIKRMIHLGTKNDEENIVLDFFSGSATTAHAVMQLNAEDAGNRKFIMVQIAEPISEKSEAYKDGFESISEVGKERIRRAGEKIKEENKDKEGIDNLDIGFRVLKVDTTNMKDVYYAANEYTQSMLAGLESNIKEDRTDLDLLYGVLLDWGLPLSLKHKIEEIEGVSVHTVDEGSLVACFAEKISEKVVREIAKRQPLRVVFRDSSFANSPDKINVEEIFKLLAPNTTVKVI
jgi:adenine-specific DNA-methyltransferase